MRQGKGITRRAFIGGGVGSGVLVWWYGRPPSDRPQLGIVGLGEAGTRHLRAAAAAGAPVVALADLVRAKADSAAAWMATQAGRRPRVHARWEHLLADPAVDAVVLAVPSHLNVRAALAALQSGKHVLAETPLLNQEAEAGSLRKAAAGAGRLVLPAMSALAPSQSRLRLAWLRTAPVATVRLLIGAPHHWSARERSQLRYESVGLILAASGPGPKALVEVARDPATPGYGTVVLGSAQGAWSLDVAPAPRGFSSLGPPSVGGQMATLQTLWRGRAGTARESFEIAGVRELPTVVSAERYRASLAALLDGIVDGSRGGERLDMALAAGAVTLALAGGAEEAA